MSETEELFNPKVKFTQLKIAKLLGLSSDKQVRNLINKGILPAAKGRNGMDPLTCLHSYITYKSRGHLVGEEPETDAFFDGEEDDGDPSICIDTERALNVREQRRARKIDNELALKSLLPTDVVISIYARIVAATREKILAIESKALTRIPQLDKSGGNLLRDLLHEALTDLSNEPIPPSLREYLEDHPFDLDAASEIND